VRAGVGRGTVSRVINGSPQVYEREGGRRAHRRGARLPAEPCRAGSRRRGARGRRAPRTRRSRARSPRSVGSPESAASVPRRPQPAARLVLISAQDDGPSSALAGHLSLQHADGALLLSLHGDDQLSRMLRDAMSQWFWAGAPSPGPASGTSTLTTRRALFHSATVWVDQARGTEAGLVQVAHQEPQASTPDRCQSGGRSPLGDQLGASRAR
jgi:hypothetical protein